MGGGISEGMGVNMCLAISPRLGCSEGSLPLKILMSVGWHPKYGCTWIMSSGCGVWLCVCEIEMCMCVRERCVWERGVCVCVCVYEREREREREE